MARPTKQGVDYFPVDTQFDDKIELYLIEKESEGLAVLITLWQLIYQNEGYYIKNGKDLFLLIKKRINVPINIIDSCINLLLDRGIFSKSLHKKHKILTSKAIQKRYFISASKKKIVYFDIDYIINGIDVSDNSVNIGRNATKEEVKEEEEEEVKEDMDAIKKTWNRFAKKYNLAEIKTLTKSRLKKIETRGKEDFDLLAILKEAGQSDFLKGSTGWKMNFDWVIENEKNYIKILEGNYNNKSEKPILTVN